MTYQPTTSTPSNNATTDRVTISIVVDVPHGQDPKDILTDVNDAVMECIDCYASEIDDMDAAQAYLDTALHSIAVITTQHNHRELEY